MYAYHCFKLCTTFYALLSASFYSISYKIRQCLFCSLLYLQLPDILLVTRKQLNTYFMNELKEILLFNDSWKKFGYLVFSLPDYHKKIKFGYFQKSFKQQKNIVKLPAESGAPEEEEKRCVSASSFMTYKSNSAPS